MRANTFLAINLREDDRHALSAALTASSPGRPLPGRRPKPSTWHMTLRFLGPIEEDRVDRVAAEVERSVTARAGRVLSRGLGAFPRPSRAGVIFAAIDDAEGILTELASQCDWAAQDAGLDPEERAFVPHITLSRLRPHQDVRKVLDAFGDFRVVIRIDTVSLMQTTIVRGELRYDELETFPLDR